MIQPDESNPISKSLQGNQPILSDQSLSPDFWRYLADSMSQREADGLSRFRNVSNSDISTAVERNGYRLIQFGSNDYLGLSVSSELEARVASQERSQPMLAQNETRAHRFGSGASPLVTGYSSHHEALADAIATFEGAEDALVFSSGYAANVGVVSALASPQDVIFSDQLNHASLIDGCRLSKAKTHVYPHGDIAELRCLVQKHRHQGRFAFVITDSIFSMDGDLAPLMELNQLCTEYDMLVIVDEAHGTGVYGHTGRGLCEHLYIDSPRFVRIGTLSKAVGCIGGFVSGDALLIQWLANHCRSWIYSTAMPIPTVVRCRHAIEMVQAMHSQRSALQAMSIKLRGRLRDLGHIVGAGDSPIVPVYFPSVVDVVKASNHLLQSGLYVPAIRPPTVPEGKCMLRISLCALHTNEQLDQLVDALADV
jgi:8-amino-7-oxononanoate synthase